MLALNVLFTLGLSRPSAALSDTFQDVFFTYVGLDILILTNVYLNMEQMDTLTIVMGRTSQHLPPLASHALSLSSVYLPTRGKWKGWWVSENIQTHVRSSLVF